MRRRKKRRNSDWHSARRCIGAASEAHLLDGTAFGRETVGIAVIPCRCRGSASGITARAGLPKPPARRSDDRGETRRSELALYDLRMSTIRRSRRPITAYRRPAESRELYRQNGTGRRRAAMLNRRQSGPRSAIGFLGTYLVQIGRASGRERVCQYV